MVFVVPVGDFYSVVLDFSRTHDGHTVHRLGTFVCACLRYSESKMIETGKKSNDDSGKFERIVFEWDQLVEPPNLLLYFHWLAAAGH